jgi:hypothetical protein
MVAVSQGDRMTAVFPHERAVYNGEATRAGMGDLLGVALAPSEIMDLLGGTPPQTIQLRRLRFRAGLACDIAGRLSDGTMLKIRVEDAQLSALSEQAFADPACPGCRSVSAHEAAELWTR